MFGIGARSVGFRGISITAARALEQAGLRAVATRRRPRHGVARAREGAVPRIASRSGPSITDRGAPGPGPVLVLSHQGPTAVPKQDNDTVDRLVRELMDRQLSKAERMKRLRELVQSGQDVPDELMDQALRKLMESLTD
jgi:hypothetical protein